MVIGYDKDIFHVTNTFAHLHDGAIRDVVQRNDAPDQDAISRLTKAEAEAPVVDLETLPWVEFNWVLLIII